MASFLDNLTDHLTFDIQTAERDIEDALQNLAYKCENLARSLTRTAAECRREIDDETNGTQASINSCGEVQGYGTDIDRLCGEIRLRRDMLARLKSLQNVTE